MVVPGFLSSPLTAFQLGSSPWAPPGLHVAWKAECSGCFWKGSGHLPHHPCSEAASLLGVLSVRLWLPRAFGLSPALATRRVVTVGRPLTLSESGSPLEK